MNPWFTVEIIDPNTFAISEYQHWEQTHCYLLLGTQKALLIDSGLGVQNISTVVHRLTNQPVLLATTHAHWDHIGGHWHFPRIAVHAQEREWLEQAFPLPLDAVKANIIQRPCSFPPDFQLEHYRIFQGTPTMILHHQDILSLGHRQVQVLHTPGHSPGHVCFFEPRTGYLFSGDLIYQGTLDAFYPSTDPLAFWQSIQLVKQLPLKKILPGHYTLHIPLDLVEEIDRGFTTLWHQGKLQQGQGLFSFPHFNIHL